MRLFSCPSCKLAVFFSNVKCERCAVELGYDPATHRMIALVEGAPYKPCSNHPHQVCNWLLPAASPETRCRACRHNEVIPDLSIPENLPLWQRMEEAKHRLLYTILRLKLPLFDRTERPDDGLGFQFLAADDPKTVMTGHAGGLITIALIEATTPSASSAAPGCASPTARCSGTFATRSATGTGTSWSSTRPRVTASSRCSAIPTRTTARRSSATTRRGRAPPGATR